MKIAIICMGLVVIMGLCGCATLESMFDMSSDPPPSENKGLSSLEQTKKDQLKFSENPNIGAFNDRRYRRVTKKSLEDESDVGSRAGSLWNTEGPSSYLFTQNKLHREGDLLTIKVEGNAKTQVDSKIQVIKKLLARLDIVSPAPGAPSNGPVAENAPANRDPATANPSASSNTPTAGAPPAATGGATSMATKPSEPPEEEAPINIETIPTRVAERMGDGNYRVKGQQSFMIGKKEFRVIVTGLVRPEDFSDEGISSNKLLDPQIDVVSLRRSLQ